MMKIVKQKQPIIALLIIVFITILSIYLERKNTLRVEKIIDCSKIDRFLFNKLDSLVTENRFNRQYYEVIVFYNSGCGNSFVLNYNTKYQLLSISSDPSSGFSGSAKISKEELSKIADSNIKIENFYQFYKSEYPKNYRMLPTRACNPSLLDIIFD